MLSVATVCGAEEELQIGDERCTGAFGGASALAAVEPKEIPREDESLPTWRALSGTGPLLQLLGSE